MKIDPQIVLSLIIFVVLIIIGTYGCSGMKRQPLPIETAREDAQACGGILSTNSIVFECDFWSGNSAKVYYFQHNGKDHYVAVGRNGGIAVK